MLLNASESIELVSRIRNNEPAAMLELYGVTSNFRHYFAGHQPNGSDGWDSAQDLYIEASGSIQAGDLRDPSRLIPFLVTFARNLLNNRADKAYVRRADSLDIERPHVTADTCMTPEARTYHHQQQDIVTRSLEALDARKRDVLVGFYLNEETGEEMRAERDMTKHRFDCMKNRAMGDLGRAGKKILSSHRRHAKSQTGPELDRPTLCRPG